MNKPFFHPCWALIALMLTACDPPPAPTAADRVETPQPSGGMASSRPDELARLLNETKDHLAENRTDQAQKTMNRLRMLKSSLPAERQLDIDRLDAMFADDSSLIALPFKH